MTKHRVGTGDEWLSDPPVLTGRPRLTSNRDAPAREPMRGFERRTGWHIPGAFAVLLVVAVSRSPYVLIHGRFWAEEGAVHFQHMFEHHRPSDLLFVYGHSGYFDVFCNAATWLAAHVSLTAAPLVPVWLSFGVLVVLLWIVLYWPSPLLPTAVARITVAALFIAGPVAIPGVWLNSLEAQTYLTLITVLLLFVQLERLTAVRFWTGAASIATATLSGVYAGILAPLFVVRAFVQRTGRAVLYAAVATIGAAIQLAVVAHLHIQGQTSDTKLVFRGFGAIVRNVAAYHIVGFVFGPHVAARAHGASRGIAGFVALFLFATAVLAFIATLLVHTRDRRLPMLLLGALLLEELGINYGASNNSFGRFAVVPIGILILMLVYGTATATASARRLLGIGLCTVVLVFGFFSFWTYQPSHLRCRGCPDWSQQVAQWRTGRSDRLAIWPYPAWHISPIRAPTQQQ